MIPISIRFEAFGPYVTAQEIDFSRFMTAGLVLIHGETGAGKTVILDAMTYALYGRSSGGMRGDFSSMRCLCAAADAPTRVEYTFDVHGKRYRFTRGLRIRKKRSGEIEYLLEQDAFFLDADGNFAPFFENPRLRDLEAKAQELIGLTCEQFCQVMILPQGQFERLLVAKSDEKEAVLVSLFHAERWQQIADSLCTRANGMKQELDAQKAAIKAVLESYGCADADGLRERETQTAAELSEKTSARETAAKELDTKRKLLDGAVQLESLFEKREQAAGAAQALQARLPEIEQKKMRLARGREAAKIVPQYEQMCTLEKISAQREGEAAQAERTLAGAAQGLDAARVRLDDLIKHKPQNEANKAALVRLQTLLESYRRLDEARKRRDTTLAIWEQADAQAMQNDARMQVQSEQKERISAQRAEIFERYTARLPELREHLTLIKKTHVLLEKQAQAKDRLAGNDKSLERLEKELTAARETLELAEKTQRECSQRYLENAAAALAAELSDGAPCPVCGSTHHPQAHQSASSDVTREQMRQAADAVQCARRTLAECETRRAQAQAGLALLREELAALDMEQAQAVPYHENELDALKAEVETAESENAKLEPLGLQLKQMEAVLVSVREDAQVLAQALIKAASDRERALAQYEALLAQKDESIADSDALDVRISALKRESEVFQTALQEAEQAASACALAVNTAATAFTHLQGELERARKDHDAARGAVDELLAAGGFADRQAFLEAVVCADELTGLEQELSCYQAEKEVLARQLEELNTQLTGRERPSITARQAEITTLEQDKAALDAAWGGLSQAYQQMKASLDDIEQKQARLDERRLVYDRLSAFGKLLRGDSGVSLRRYVLGVMLSSITAEANRLLQSVHGGRYQLFRTMEGTGRSRKAGLDLEVLDAHSGMRRGVASLSGGEKFLVSLALALGLSAVVQAQSGGIRMDAMFIDEGFGSLDPQSIADALDVLASVKGSRRVVGIISHVSTLRESIETSIEVVKDRSGSRLVIHA
ncbi:SMC family ATPase [Oscillospiraceae bacterium PP1C4]